MAMMPEPVREVLRELPSDHVVGVVSGRDLNDLRRRVDLDDLYYAGDHGYRIAGPPHTGVELEVGGLQERLELRLTMTSNVVSAPSCRCRREHQGHLSIRALQAGGRRSTSFGRFLLSTKQLVQLPNLKLTRGKLRMSWCAHLPWDKGRAVVWLDNQLCGVRRSALSV